MIRSLTIAVAAIAGFVATPALAKQYVDYSPEKGVWEINAIEVDPNHIDDYLTGLKKTQVPGFDILKKRGLIDDYRFVVRTGYVKGSPNVLIQVHFTSVAALAPDKARDMAIDKEIEATLSEEAGKVAVAGYEKYRQFIDDGLWTEMKYAK